MNAIELIQRLERIVAEHGPAIQVEVRNVAGDRDYLDYVGVAFNSRVSVVQLETWPPEDVPLQDYDRGDGVWRQA